MLLKTTAAGRSAVDGPRPVEPAILRLGLYPSAVSRWTAGVIYNWWLVRTKSLGDCVLAHAVTNLALGIYVVAAGQWQYWL